MKSKSWIFTLLSLAVFLLLPSFGFAQDIKEILAAEYEYKMISSGKNYPTVNIRDNNLGDICILLHHRVSVNEICRHYGWTEQNLQARLDTLLKEGLIKKDEKFGYLPTCMVITFQDSQEAIRQDENLLRKSVELIVKNLPEVKRLYNDIDGLKEIPFSKASLFILSDVLLDNWQIDKVERQWLGAERTLRNGMNYYYSIQQKNRGEPTEAFGIYGNMYRSYGTVLVGLYGNQRQGINFINLTSTQLKDWFGMQETETSEAFKQRLLEELLRFSKDSQYKLSQQHESRFERIGFVQNRKLVIPVLNPADQEKISEIAGLISDELMELLSAYKGKLKRSYQSSVYKDEISFEEYAIWWYHFYYTKVTDILIDKGHISKPLTGVFTYLLYR